MATLTNPENRGLIKLAKVQVTVETEAPVHGCERCGREEPCAVTRSVETDRDWKNGAIHVERQPAGWTRFYLVGACDALGNPLAGGRNYELCPDCQVDVQRLLRGVPEAGRAPEGLTLIAATGL